MNAQLTPYFPRLLIEWDEQMPDAAFRSIEGSLVFMDISGFTAMSERLARRGKVGAEEVTEVMSATFADLLGAAYEQSGYLLKFGGDAMLLFFSGDDHPARAARAAFEMRRRLRAIGRFATSAGRVLLRMSVGVHSGEVLFILAGESHRELVVTGPAVTRTVEMESAAHAGDVLVSADTAAALEPACLGEARDGGFLLRRAPRGGAAVISTLVAQSYAGGEQFIPVAVRAHLQSATEESEHRQVTIAFIHFEGIDALLDSRGAEEVAARMDTLVRTAQRAAAEHEVCFLATDIDRDGGKIILTAGAPSSAGDDEERMLRALRAIVESEPPIALRIGVNRGPIFAGDVGPAYRRTYTVMGDAVNLAARLMARAEPGQILASPAVLERSGAVFRTHLQAPFFVKGKAQPVTALSVGRMLAERAQSAETDVPLLGRDAELAQLTAALRHAEAGNAAVVELIGAAGIGKTRLTRELRSRHPSVAYVETAADPYGASTPYFAMRRMLRAAMRMHPRARTAEQAALLRERVTAIAPELLPWLPLIAVVLDVPEEPTPESEQLEQRFRKARLFEAVGGLMLALFSQPTLVVFEDAHWLDEASRDLLRYLIANVETAPWLMCVMHRPDAGLTFADLAAHGSIIELPPLSDEAALALAAVDGHELALSQHDVRKLTQRAGGNPLFLRQIVASRIAQPDGGIPDSIEALMTARIDRLNPRERQLLRYASVLGQSFRRETLLRSFAELLPATSESDWRRLEEFIIQDGPDSVRFQHTLLQEVAYEGLPFRRRRDLHGHAGAYLERREGEHADDIAELLSLHFSRAQDAPKAYRYSRVAAERSKQRFANVEAAEFFNRAIHAARDMGLNSGGDLGTLYEARGDVCELAGLYEQAAAAYRGAAGVAEWRSSTPGGLALKQGIIRERLGRYTQALRWYGRALRGSQTDAASRVKLGLAYAGVRFRQGRYRDCARWAGDVMREAEASGDQAGLAHACYLLDHAYTMLGSAEAGKYRARALPIFEELGDLVGQANVLNNLGVSATIEGRWGEAMDYFRRSRDARDKAGDVVGAATALNNMGEILSDRGEIEDAEALFTEALRVWRAARYRVGVAVATGNLGRAATRAGRLDEAKELLTDALTAFEEMGAESFVVETELRVVERLIFAGEHADALSHIRRVLARSERMDGMIPAKAMLQRLLGEALGFSGETGPARAAFEESLHLARSVHADFEVALSLEAYARLLMERGFPADSLLKESADIRQRLGVVAIPSPEGRSRSTLAAG